MAQNDTRLAEYLVECTIALLPDVKEDFKPGKSLLNDGSFQLTEPHFEALSLEHRFLKRVRSKDNPDQYVWQIRIFDPSLVISPTEDQMFESLHEVVSRTLAPFDIPVSRTILKEIAAAESQ